MDTRIETNTRIHGIHGYKDIDKYRNTWIQGYKEIQGYMDKDRNKYKDTWIQGYKEIQEYMDTRI